MVKTYNCTDGGAQWCQGCYTMEESTDHNGKPDGYGEWVSKEAYDAAIVALRVLSKEMALSGNIGSKDYGWPKAITAARAILDSQCDAATKHRQVKGLYYVNSNCVCGKPWPCSLADAFVESAVKVHGALSESQEKHLDSDAGAKHG
jgi:hypothetical protein